MSVSITIRTQRRDDDRAQQSHGSLPEAKRGGEEMASSSYPIVTVTAHVYSGRKDPTWLLSKEQITQLLSLLSALGKPTFNKPLGPYVPVGYHGITVTSEGVANLPNSMFVYQTIVSVGLLTYNLLDMNSSIEKFLVSTGKGRLKPSVLAMILDAGSSLKRKRAAKRLALPEVAPPYAPDTWNANPFTMSENNCYNYANDMQLNNFAQPGASQGLALGDDDMNCATVSNYAQQDGLVPVAAIGPDPEHGHYVALVVWPDEDFHWFRLDSTGTWSHKPGEMPATDLDDEGNPIVDPSTAPYGEYAFCGYFLSDPAVVQLGP